MPADCLIAAVGMRRDATVVHFDADFDVIASCVPLRTLSLPPGTPATAAVTAPGTERI